jgi:iron-sulfur cluster repair protein YtfE (RIC family)
MTKKQKKQKLKELEESIESNLDQIDELQNEIEEIEQEIKRVKAKPTSDLSPKEKIQTIIKAAYKKAREIQDKCNHNWVGDGAPYGDKICSKCDLKKEGGVGGYDG